MRTGSGVCAALKPVSESSMKGEAETAAANSDQRMQFLLGWAPSPCATLLHWLMAGVGNGAGRISTHVETLRRTCARAVIIVAVCGGLRICQVTCAATQ